MSTIPHLRCYYHPRRQVTNQCDRCQDFLCDECTIELEGRPLCRSCWDELSPEGKDTKHLNMLSVAYYVFAVFAGIGSCIPLIHIGVGVAMVAGSIETDNPEISVVIGPIFIVIGTLVMAVGWALTVCIFLTGRYLRRRRHRTFCMVIAGICSMQVPVGTVLGVLTIVLLSKSSAASLFDTGNGRR